MSRRRQDKSGASPSLGPLDTVELPLDRGAAATVELPPSRGAPPTRELPAPAAVPGPPRRRWGWLWLALPLLAGLAALGYWREQLGERLVPESPLAQQLESAQAALARGELSRGDGQGARELFQAVLAVDPDHPSARAGLAAVRDAALQQAQAALDAGDTALAQKALALATTLSAPASALQPLEARLLQMQATPIDLEAALAEAQALHRTGQDEAALAAYDRILLARPGNTLALDGRRRLHAEWLAEAARRLDAGDVIAAQALVQKVVDRDPSHLDLPALQARLGEARAHRERDMAAERELAEADLKAGRLEAAASRYQALLRETPDSPGDRAGLERAATQQANRAARYATEFEFERAEAALALARAWAPDLAAVRAAEQRLQQSRASREKLASEPVAGPAELPRLLAEAEAAIRRGELIEPPGDSAWDKLRAASALAPRDEGVMRAFAAFDRRAGACFEEELLANRLSAAEACLDARALRATRQTLVPEAQRLAQRWLALASERIGQNEPEQAMRALVAARRLDPAAPGMAEIEQRLRLVMDARR